MKTFIWAADCLNFTEYQFFVAHADNLDDARVFIKNQLQCDHESRIHRLNERKENGELVDKLYEDFKNDAKLEYSLLVSSIDKHDPSHVISAGMGMCIHHANY
jgi:hypothetical protein